MQDGEPAGSCLKLGAAPSWGLPGVGSLWVPALFRRQPWEPGVDASARVTLGARVAACGSGFRCGTRLGSGNSAREERVLPDAPRRMLAEILFWSFLAASERLRRRPAGAGAAAAGAGAPCGCEAAAFLPPVSFFRTDILPSLPDFCLVSVLHAQPTHWICRMLVFGGGGAPGVYPIVVCCPTAMCSRMCPDT